MGISPGQLSLAILLWVGMKQHWLQAQPVMEMKRRRVVQLSARSFNEQHRLDNAVNGLSLSLSRKALWWKTAHDVNSDCNWKIYTIQQLKQNTTNLCVCRWAARDKTSGTECYQQRWQWTDRHLLSDVSRDVIQQVPVRLNAAAAAGSK